MTLISKQRVKQNGYWCIYFHLNWIELIYWFHFSLFFFIIHVHVYNLYKFLWQTCLHLHISIFIFTIIIIINITTIINIITTIFLILFVYHQIEAHCITWYSLCTYINKFIQLGVSINYSLVYIIHIQTFCFFLAFISFVISMQKWLSKLPVGEKKSWLCFWHFSAKYTLYYVLPLSQ